MLTKVFQSDNLLAVRIPKESRRVVEGNRLRYFWLFLQVLMGGMRWMMKRLAMRSSSAHRVCSVQKPWSDPNLFRTAHPCLPLFRLVGLLFPAIALSVTPMVSAGSRRVAEGNRLRYFWLFLQVLLAVSSGADGWNTGDDEATCHAIKFSASSVLSTETVV
jgi:hypothetical protein